MSEPLTAKEVQGLYQSVAGHLIFCMKHGLDSTVVKLPELEAIVRAVWDLTKILERPEPTAAELSEIRKRFYDAFSSPGCCGSTSSTP